MVPRPELEVLVLHWQYNTKGYLIHCWGVSEDNWAQAVIQQCWKCKQLESEVRPDAVGSCNPIVKQCWKCWAQGIYNWKNHTTDWHRARQEVICLRLASTRDKKAWASVNMGQISPFYPVTVVPALLSTVWVAKKAILQTLHWKHVCITDYIW